MAFRALTQNEISALPPEQSEVAGFKPVPLGLRGGIGFEIPSEVAAEIANLRQIASESPQTGLFPEVDQTTSAISRGLLSGATAELGEAALEESIQEDRFDPESPQFTNPLTYGTSEFIGSFAPVGKVTKIGLGVKSLVTGGKQAGKTVLKRSASPIKEGAAFGLGYGLAGAEAQNLRADAGLEDSLTNLIKGGTIGATVGAGTAGIISKASALKMKPSESFVAFVKPKVGSKAETRTFEFIDGNKLDEAVGSVKSFFKIPKNITTEEAKDITYSAADNLISKVDDVIKQFPSNTLKGSPLKQGVDQVVNSKLLKALDPSSQSELAEIAQKIAVDRPLKEGFVLQKEINKLMKSYINSIKEGGDPKVNDKIRLLDSLRKANSSLLDNAITGLTGSADNPYRRWGSVNELANVIHSRYRNLANLRAQEKAAGFFPSIGGKDLKTIASGPYNYVVGGEMKNADTLISSIFNNIPEYKPSPLLPSVAAQRVSKSIAPPSPPSPSSSPQNLQSFIQQSLSTQKTPKKSP